VIAVHSNDEGTSLSKDTETFVNRVLEVRDLHCHALWDTIRAESLESVKGETKYEAQEEEDAPREEGSDRREWLGYATKEEERVAQARHREEKRRRQAVGLKIEEIRNNYNELEAMATDGELQNPLSNEDQEESWKDYWSQSGPK
jgi:hypothetical protein